MISVLAHSAQVVGIWLGGAMVWTGMWVVAQSVNLNEVGSGIVGTFVLAAGIYVTRMVVKGSERVEASFVGALEAANDRSARCEETCRAHRAIDAADRASLGAENAELRAALDEERALRIAMETNRP